MLFIFGYNASWMRLSKLSQLIHKSSTLQHITKASVEVQFTKVLDGEDGVARELPGTGFTIKRSVNSNSVSKYYINDSESTQAAVKDQLRG